MSQNQITLPSPATHIESLTWFRFGELGNKILMTTDTGQWHALKHDEFSDLLSGELSEENDHYGELLRKGFIRNGFDVELHAGQLRQAKGYLQAGALQHRIHLSTDQDTLTIEQAKSILDHIFTCPTEFLTISLIQGPKPPNAQLISFIHEFAEEKNKYEKRSLVFELHSSLATVDEALIDVLLEKRIFVRAFFDGCSDVHNAQTQERQGPIYADALATIQAIHTAAHEKDLNRDEYSVFAEVGVGSTAAGKGQSVVAGLTEAGICNFQVTPILQGPNAISPSAYGLFIQEMMAVQESHEDGDTVGLREVQTGALLERIQLGEVNGTLLMSSPPSNGYNTRSYGPNGNIFPSCSALQLHDKGDPIFLLGNVSNQSSEDISNHPTVRTLMVASLTDCLPGYQHLWSAPFIGIDPVAAYSSTGDIFTKMPTSLHHQATQAMVEAVFMYLMQNEATEDTATEDTATEDTATEDTATEDTATEPLES